MYHRAHNMRYPSTTNTIIKYIYYDNVNSASIIFYCVLFVDYVISIRIQERLRCIHGDVLPVYVYHVLCNLRN